MNLILAGAHVVSKKDVLSKDGQRRFYNLNVERDGDVFQFPCEELVYQSVELFKPYDFVLSYTKTFWDGKLRENMRLVAFSK